MKKFDLEWTGERLVTSVFNFGAIDHLHRYSLAFDLVKNKDVLDIASGEGYGSFLLALHAKSIVGVDISEETVQHAIDKYNKNNLQFKVGSADSIPLDDNSIDIVTSFETIEHHDKHNEMMQEIKRVLKSDGILLISSPDKLNYSELPNIKNPFHVKELYQQEFKQLLQKFFSNVVFLNQKNVFGSLIIPEKDISVYEEFAGYYDSVSKFIKMQSPVYNLCIASDVYIKYNVISFFDGKNAIDSSKDKEILKLSQELISIKKSKTFKISLFFSTLIKKLT